VFALISFLVGIFVMSQINNRDTGLPSFEKSVSLHLFVRKKKQQFSIADLSVVTLFIKLLVNKQMGKFYYREKK